jgi:hypothetical protein
LYLHSTYAGAHNGDFGESKVTDQGKQASVVSLDRAVSPWRSVRSVMRLSVDRLAACNIGVDDRAEAHGDGGAGESSSPSLGPDPLTFWNSVVQRSSNTQISDPRSIALPIAMGWIPCRFVMGTTTDPQVVELFVETLTTIIATDGWPIRETAARRTDRPR